MSENSDSTEGNRNGHLKQQARDEPVGPPSPPQEVPVPDPNATERVELE